MRRKKDGEQTGFYATMSYVYRYIWFENLHSNWDKHKHVKARSIFHDNIQFYYN